MRRRSAQRRSRPWSGRRRQRANVCANTLGLGGVADSAVGALARTGGVPVNRRVVVTGMGVVCPFGADIEATWAAIRAGHSAIVPRTFVNARSKAELVLPVAEVPEAAIVRPDREHAPYTDKFTMLAMQAANAALDMSGLNLADADRDRIGVASGSCLGGIMDTDAGFQALFVRERPRVHPFTVIRSMQNGPASFIAIQHRLRGPLLHYSTACSSSSVAIGESVLKIRHGYADTMIAGGSETTLVYSGVNVWNSGQVLAPVADDPAASCRPFDLTRNGTVLGEGAAFFVLETLEHARARGANILAEVAGYGCAGDTGHVTQPSPGGQAAAMRLALEDARIECTRVGYIQAHGTGTKLNDEAETVAIKRVFGEHAYRLAISSSKSMVGHMVGAAGAFGALLAILALRDHVFPPTAHLTHPDPSCDLDYVPHVARQAPGLDVAMVNAFGFGGTATTLVLQQTTKE